MKGVCLDLLALLAVFLDLVNKQLLDGIRCLQQHRRCTKVAAQNGLQGPHLGGQPSYVHAVKLNFVEIAR